MAELSDLHSIMSPVSRLRVWQSASGLSQLFHQHTEERVLKHEISPNKAAIGKAVIYIKTDVHKCKLKNKPMNKQSNIGFISVPQLHQENILDHTKKTGIKK